MRVLALLLLLPGLAQAETVVAARTIRAQQILAPEDIRLVAGEGAVANPADVIGLEARRTLYAGRPVSFDDLGPPAIVDRNEIVPLAYSRGGLQILSEGRALARGGVGEVIRVMNLASRTTIQGRITAEGLVIVGPAP
jgi:flagella basal body P-ring formation protein FlgA